MKVLVSGYEVLVRRRGSDRRLECCREEVDDGKKRERQGESEPTRSDFCFFFFFFSKRDKWRQRCRALTGVSVD